MRVFLIAVLAALGLVGIDAGAASAGDWRDGILGPSVYREPLPGSESPRARRSEARAPRAERTARAERPTRTARVATASDEEAPQRKGRRSQPRQTESLSGGEQGIASYYWQPQRVAAGGWFNPNAMTAAHKSLPFGTRVRVTRADNGDSVDVTINDRGPYIAGRIIDLSRAAAASIGMTGQGITRVRVSVLGRG